MKKRIIKAAVLLVLLALCAGLASCGGVEDLLSEAMEEEFSSLLTETAPPESAAPSGEDDPADAEPAGDFTEDPGEEETGAPEESGEETAKEPEETGNETGTEAESGEESGIPEEETGLRVSEDGEYDTRDEVALYIHLYGHLPSNYITKKKAESLGWTGGSLEPYAPGKSIGGSRFGNYEGLLPEKEGRKYTECDIGATGKKSRGAKRIVFSNDGLIYYTDDHYESFTLLYGEAGE